MRKMNVRLFLSLLLGLFAISSTTWSSYDCEKFLDAGGSAADLQAEIQTARYDLTEVPRLSVEHPFSVMDANSRALAIILFGGVQQVANPTSPTGRVNFYPIFSGGTRLSNGRLIVGQLEAIHDLVEMTKARGHRLPLLLGPAGSGKSELIMIMGQLAEKLTSRHPDFYVFRYTWKDLSKIAGLKGQLISLAGEDPVIPCPLNDSPLVLLSTQQQDADLASSQPRIKEMVGSQADPLREPCPVCSYIRGEVLRHYGMEKLKSLKSEQKERLETLKNKHRRGQTLSKEEDKALKDLMQQGELTGDEIVAALAKHVDIRRLVFDSRASAPVIDAQPKDVDWGGLVASPNPILRAAKGPGHEMAWHLDGRLPKANGSFLFLDELLRNPKDFRDTMLRVFESRRLTIGGMPDLPLDAWMLAASNKETVTELMSDGGNKAFLDRMRVILFNWSTRPHEVEKLLALFAQKQMDVRQKRLGRKVAEEGKPVEVWEEEPSDLNLLFPLPEPGKPLQGPDHRYNLWVNRQGQRIHVSPHVLLFMGQVLAATRISTDPDAAKKVLNASDPLKIMNSNIFRNPVARLRVYMGEERPTDSQLLELQQLSIRLGEGSFGISSRDGETWLETALAEAAKPHNAGCLTPQVAILTFRQLLDQGTIQFPNNETRVQWEALMQSMAKAFLVRDLKMDIDTAYSRDTGVVDTTYKEVIWEIMALNDDPQATQYLDPETNQRRAINRARLEEISKRYAGLRGRPLAIEQIAIQHMRSGKGGAQGVQDSGLKEAIVAYFAQRTLETVRIPDLLRFADTGEGGESVQHVFRGFTDMMLHDLGYCEHCLRQSLDFAQQMAAREGQVK